MKTNKQPEAAEQSAETTAAAPSQSPSATPHVPWMEIVKIALTHLEPSPTNPRRKFNPEKMAELENSMRAAGFSLSTLLVRPMQETLRIEKAGSMWYLLKADGAHSDGWRSLDTYQSEEAAQEAMKARSGMFEIVAGERRYRAAKAVGVLEAPCIVQPLTDEEVLRFQLVENIQRDDLTAMEEAQGFRRLLALRDPDGKPVHTTATLHQRTGKSIRHIERIVKLCVISEDPGLSDFAKALDEGVVSQKHGLLVARVADPKQRAKFAKEILDPQYEEAPLSTRRAEQLLQQHYMVDTRAATFDLADATLLPVETDPATGARICGGACKDCPHLYANVKHLFAAEEPERSELRKAGENISRGGVDTMCLFPSCFGRKQSVEWEQWQKAETKPEKNRRALDAAQCKKVYQYGDQLAWGCGYVDLSQRPDSFDLKPGKEAPGTWRSLVKGSDIEVLVARDRNGRAHELVRRDVAITAALGNGHKELKSPDKAAEEHDENLPLQGGGETEEQKAKRLREAAKREEREEMENLVEERTDLAIGAALAEKATGKPPAGFWRFLCECWGVYFDDGFDRVGARRGWPDGYKLKDQIKKLSETQAMGFYLEVYYHSNGSEKERGELLTLFGVDVKQIEKNVRAAVKVEVEAKAAEQKLRESMNWNRQRDNANDFSFNSANVCEQPDVCAIFLPAKKAKCEISVALSKKGWHLGFDLRAEKAADGEDGELPSQVATAYSSRPLALKVGLQEAQNFFKKASPAIHEHLTALVKLLEAEAPAAEAKKNAKKK